MTLKDRIEKLERQQDGPLNPVTHIVRQIFKPGSPPECVAEIRREIGRGIDSPDRNDGGDHGHH